MYKTNKKAQNEGFAEKRYEKQAQVRSDASVGGSESHSLPSKALVFGRNPEKRAIKSPLLPPPPPVKKDRIHGLFGILRRSVPGRTF